MDPFPGEDGVGGNWTLGDVMRVRIMVDPLGGLPFVLREVIAVVVTAMVSLWRLSLLVRCLGAVMAAVCQAVVFFRVVVLYPSAIGKQRSWLEQVGCQVSAIIKEFGQESIARFDGLKVRSVVVVSCRLV